MTDTVVTQESNAAHGITPVTSVTRNIAPLSNAERQRLWRQRKKLQQAKSAHQSTDIEHEPGTSTQGDKPKRPCPPTPVAEKPYVDPDRPSLYTEAIVAEICDRLAHGETLVKICRGEHLPSRTTVLRWVNENRDNFGGRFARARDLQFEYWADQLIETGDAVIAKPEMAPGARLACENRRWLLARLKPSLYSEKFQADLTSAGQPLQAASSLDLAKALAAALQARALPAPLDVEAIEVKLEGEQP